MSVTYGRPCRCSASGRPHFLCICPRCLTCQRPLELGEKVVRNWRKAKHERLQEQQQREQLGGIG